MSRVWIALMCFVITAAVSGQEITVPERPADHLWDQTGLVAADDRAALKVELADAEKKTGLGVYVVLLNSVAEEPPLDLARRLADNWKGSADRAVLVSGPGMSPPLAIAVSGESLGAAPEAAVNGMIGLAQEAAAGIEPALAAAREAARNLVAQVAAYRAGGPLGPAPASVAENSPGQGNYLVAWIAGGSLVCCLVALFLMRRGRRSALIFPQTEFRHRFSAPHSGGNDAVVFFERDSK